MVIIVTPGAKLKVNSDHFAQRHQKKDAQKLLQEIQDLSRCQGESNMCWIMATTNDVCDTGVICRGIKGNVFQ